MKTFIVSTILFSSGLLLGHYITKENRETYEIATALISPSDTLSKLNNSDIKRAKERLEQHIDMSILTGIDKLNSSFLFPDKRKNLQSALDMSLKLRYPQILEEFDKRLKVVEGGIDAESREWAAAETEARKELIVEYVNKRKVEQGSGGNAD